MWACPIDSKVNSAEMEKSDKVTGSNANLKKFIIFVVKESGALKLRGKSRWQIYRTN
jgi:hypothetical protein